MIRILHIIATLDPAGTERQLTALCLRLDSGEFEPAVCCLTRGGPLEERLLEAGVPVYVLNKRGRWDLRVIAQAVRLIEKFKPDIVHTWLPTANTIGRVAAIGAGVKRMVASERAADIWKGRLRRMADRTLAARTSRIIANAEAVRRFLIGGIGIPDEKIVVIRNGLDIAEFDGAASSGPSPPLPEREGRFILGTVARLEEQKGIRFLIEAMTELPADLGYVHLWIAGAGPLEGELRRQAEESGLSGRVHFLGLRDDVPALLRIFDLFVLPSLWEGLPNVVLEAMAARLAVVATAVDGTPEAVIHGETGLLVPPRNPFALAKALARLIRDEADRKRLGEAGRRRVEAEFGMDRMVRETEDLYRMVIAE